MADRRHHPRRRQLWGYNYWKAPGTAIAESPSTPIARGDIVQSVTANGSLTPVRLVEVGSQISGVITDLRADFNSKVKGGEVVAQIDPAGFRTGAGAGRGGTGRRRGLRNSPSSISTDPRIFSRASSSRSRSYDQAKATLSQARATVKTRQANVERARVDLSRTTIYAPMDGVVITRKVRMSVRPSRRA